MFMEERLHIRHLKQTFVIAGYKVIPHQSSTLFDNGANGIHIDDIIADFFHQDFQDTLIDAWEALCISQILNIQLHKPCAESCFILYETGDIIKLVTICLEPVRNHVVAIRLVRSRDEPIQACKMFRAHSSGSRSQQNMRS